MKKSSYYTFLFVFLNFPFAISFSVCPQTSGRTRHIVQQQRINFPSQSLLNRIISNRVTNGRVKRLHDTFVLTAKKKKGPAASSLAQLEALEAQEALLFGDDDVKEPTVIGKAPTKKKKKGPKGIDTDALLSAIDGQNDDAENDQTEVSSKLPKEKEKATKDNDQNNQKHSTQDVKEDSIAPPPPVPVAEEAYSSKEPDSPVEMSDEAAQDPVAPYSAVDQDEEEWDEDRVTLPGEETKEDRMKKVRPPPRVRIASGSSQPGFVSLRLENIAVTFKNQDVLTDATWEVKTGDRVGLVGVNGGGKTTQLKILTGELEPLSGEIIKSAPDLRISYLKQEFVDELDPNRTLREELLTVFSKELETVKQLEECQVELEQAASGDLSKMDEIIVRLNQLQAKVDSMRIDTFESQVQKVISQMGFVPSDADQKVSSYSGGWKMRIGLAKILLQDPNVLLLDEPTNHLDIDSVEWMENFLRNQNLPMVIVSHDREFLDRVCTSIVDCEAGITTQYDGNYSRFLKLKKARVDAWEAAWENQERKIKEDQDFIKRFKMISSKGAAVQSREKALERLKESPDYVKKPPRLGKRFQFRFPPAPRSSGASVVMDEVTHGYDGKVLFQDVSIGFERGDRVAFLGPNGAGKSTLLRLMVGTEKPDRGTVEKGSETIKINYFEQNQADALNLELTVLQTIEEVAPNLPYNEIRALLGQFLFKGDSAYKKVRSLSGGEKARLALCRMMLQPANVLVLDEPTNHLDIPAKEMLEEALRYFEGTVLVVSHDRYFISQVANTICNIVDNELEVYPGDYRFFMEKNKQMKEKIESRYVEGLEGIKAAPKVQVNLDQVDDKIQKKKKNFGGRGGPTVTSGNKTKGIKNAKRMEI